MQPLHIVNPKKCIGHSGPLWLVGLKMKPHAIPSDAEIAWVRLGCIRWVGEHLLKSQDSTVIVFCSGRIRNRNDRNGAGDHDAESGSGFMWPNVRPELRGTNNAGNANRARIPRPLQADGWEEIS